MNGEFAVLTVNAPDATLSVRLMAGAWSRPEYQVPHLANFVHRQTHAGRPLTTAAYARLGEALWPAVQPVPHASAVADAAHRYRLVLNPHGGPQAILRVETRAARPRHGRPWRLVCIAHGPAALYREAAYMVQRRLLFRRAFTIAYPAGTPGCQSEQNLVRQQAKYQRWADEHESRTPLVNGQRP